MTTKFAVLGDGAWGTAIALVLAQNPDQRVSLWSAREESGRLLRERRENVRLLPGVPIPQAVELTTDVQLALDAADLSIVAIPTIYLRETLQRVEPFFHGDRPVVSLTKGLENHTFLRPSEIVHQVLGAQRVAVLSGPSHAEEVSRGRPTTVVAASDDLDLARCVQSYFHTDRFRVYTNVDVIGVELGGALKNIIGIAAGIADGLGLGDNAKSALMTRGLVEIARFGVALGGEQQTFFGLAGLGDLITTCISKHGRNRHVGERLGRGEQLPDILASMTMVAEGVYTTRSVHEKAVNMGLDMPITTEIFRVLYEHKDPWTAVSDLMLREPKSEAITPT
ncbi:MAG TPA: NAD(P)H-dependent glycerol-3-phosphate dehydrogenase [Gemmataceae bacterium]|nr:NAD(P)H-dependent glycerol-3-phosphate dehydrogenase [Gemmataceae bacterium]